MCENASVWAKLGVIKDCIQEVWRTDNIMGGAFTKKSMHVEKADEICGKNINVGEVFMTDIFTCQTSRCF